jgi:hypothetical protein
LIFSVGWNGDFLGDLKNFWGFGSQRNFDESFVEFSWAFGQRWVVFGSGSEIYFDEKQKFDFQSLWATRNQKLKIKLVRGWPKNGAQIRKSQNTGTWEKLSKSPNFDRILTEKSGRSAEAQGPFKNPWFRQIWTLDPALIFPSFTSK